MGDGYSDLVVSIHSAGGGCLDGWRARYLAVGEESEFGLLAQPVAFLDYLSASLEAPSDPLLFYEGAGGRGNRVAVPGPYIPSGDLQFGVDPIEAIRFVKWGLGRYGHVGTAVSPAVETALDGEVDAGDTTVNVDDASSLSVDDYVQIGGGIGGDVGKITGISTNELTLELGLMHPHADDSEVVKVESPFTHIFGPTAEIALPSFTARIGKNVFEHTFAGATVSGLRFSVDRGFLTCTVNVQAQKDSHAGLNAGGKSFPSTVYNFRQATTLIADVEESSNVESLELEIANGITAESGIRFGSRFTQEFPVEGIEVSGSLTLAFPDTDEYRRFWGSLNGAQESGASPFKLEQQFRSGDDWLKFIMASAYWTQVSTPVSGRGRITQAVQFVSLVDPIWDVINVEAINSKDRY